MRLALKTPLADVCEELKISPPKYLNEETRNRTEQMTLQAIEVRVALDDFGIWTTLASRGPTEITKRYLSFFTAVLGFTMMRHLTSAATRLETF